MKHKSESMGHPCFIIARPPLVYILKHTASNCETQAKVCCTKLSMLSPVILSLITMQTVAYSTQNSQFTAIH